MINGIKYDWESLNVAMDHGVLVGIQSINYEDEHETEAIYGKGSTPIGYGRGNRKGSGKLTIEREEYELLQANAGGSIYKMKPFPIILNYANEGKPTIVDTLEQCIFTKRSNSHEQGDSGTKIELDFTILGGIKLNGVEQW